LRTVNAIVDALEAAVSDADDEDVDDSDMDGDYVNPGGDYVSSSEDEDEPVAGPSQPPAKPPAKPPTAKRPRLSKAARRREVFPTSRPNGEVLVFIDPPVEKADGDTDVDSGRYIKKL
jgi:hypothetical protein